MYPAPVIRPAGGVLEEGAVNAVLAAEAAGAAPFVGEVEGDYAGEDENGDEDVVV